MGCCASRLKHASAELPPPSFAELIAEGKVVPDEREGPYALRSFHSNVSGEWLPRLHTVGPLLHKPTGFAACPHSIGLGPCPCKLLAWPRAHSRLCHPQRCTRGPGQPAVYTAPWGARLETLMS